MPQPAITTIADALVTALNGGSFAIAFTAVRAWQPVHEVEDLATLRVSVAPRSRQTTRDTRGTNVNLHVLDVTFQKQITGSTAAEVDAEVDPLAALVESVADFVDRLTLTAGAARYAPQQVTTIDPICDPDMLYQERIFTSVITTGYRERRAV